MATAPANPPSRDDLTPSPTARTAAPGRSGQRRICIISDDLSGNTDEGVKKFTTEIAAALRRQHEVHLIATHPGPDAASPIRCVPASRTFVSQSLRTELRRIDPDLLVYATNRSATFFSLLRSRLLRCYCPTAIVGLLGLQTRYHASWQQRIIRHIRPDLVYVQSYENAVYLRHLGCRAALLPSGVNTTTFRPVNSQQRLALRARYGLAIDKPLVLHVGHLRSGRGVRILAEIAKTGEFQVLLVASSSTEQEATLADELRESGVVILSQYLPRIEEIYQLSDCYVFPVVATDNAIEAPLSVFEALACDLPVVTTRFGGLPRLFADRVSSGLAFVDSTSDFVDQVRVLCARESASTRGLVAEFSWDAVASRLVEEALMSERTALMEAGKPRRYFLGYWRRPRAAAMAEGNDEEG